MQTSKIPNHFLKTEQLEQLYGNDLMKKEHMTCGNISNYQLGSKRVKKDHFKSEVKEEAAP